MYVCLNHVIIILGEAQAHESSESSQNNTKSNSDAGPNQAMLLGTLIYLLKRHLN